MFPCKDRGKQNHNHTWENYPLNNYSNIIADFNAAPNTRWSEINLKRLRAQSTLIPNRVRQLTKNLHLTYCNRKRIAQFVRGFVEMVDGPKTSTVHPKTTSFVREYRVTQTSVECPWIVLCAGYCTAPYSIVVRVLDSIVQLSEQWIHSSVKLNQLLQRCGRAHAHCTVRVVQRLDEGGLELRQEWLQHGANLANKNAPKMSHNGTELSQLPVRVREVSTLDWDERNGWKTVENNFWWEGAKNGMKQRHCNVTISLCTVQQFLFEFGSH